MKTSEKIENIAKALVQFQKEVKGITKDGAGYNYQYITIDAILSLVRPALANNGISLVQEVHSIVTEQGKVIDGVITRLTHISGEYMETAPLYIEAASTKSTKNNQGPAPITPQDHGSAMTYAKRYQLTGILGLNADVDDDAGIYNKNAKNWGQKASDEQIKMLGSLMKQKNVDKNGMQAVMMKAMKQVKACDALTPEEADVLIKELESI